MVRMMTKRSLTAKVVGWIWGVAGITGTIYAIATYWELRSSSIVDKGAIQATVIVGVFALLSLLAALIFVRGFPLGRSALMTLATVLLLYCLAFVAMIGLDFGAIPFAASLLGTIFTSSSTYLLYNAR